MKAVKVGDPMQPGTDKLYYPHREDNRVVVFDTKTDRVMKITIEGVDVERNVVFGQYEGYRDIPEVADDSDTDTLVAVEARISFS